MSINRPELFEMMGVPKAQASKMLDLVLNSITEALAKGEDVTLKGFGTFKIVELAARTGRNPQTGKALQIPAKKVVRFKAGSDLSDKVK
jgi:DNA-binding protein HU-beta